MSEVDAVSGTCSAEHSALMNMMSELGYDYKFYEKTNLKSGSCIWYKKAKFNLLE